MRLADARGGGHGAAPHRGPVFVDFPLDVVFAEGRGDGARPRRATSGVEPDPDEVARAAALLAAAERPAIIAGSDVWWDGAQDALVAAVEHLRVPVVRQRAGPGCLPADHELAFSRTRGLLQTEADVVCVIGTPLDFRLSFGRFGEAQVVHVVDHPDQRAAHAARRCRRPATCGASSPGSAHPEGRRPTTSRGSPGSATPSRPPPPPTSRCSRRPPTRSSRPASTASCASGSTATPSWSCDGGDFVSYAGKYVDSFTPGCWLDPGPYGCLGGGMGDAIAARIAHPDRQVVVLLGDGAAGFSLLDVDTLVRHQLPVVIVVGNNGIWGLEKHPMQLLYGYDVAADLQPGCRYDEVVRALGGAGETVTEPEDLGPALDRAFAPACPTWSTCSPTRPTPTPARRTWPDGAGG